MQSLGTKCSVTRTWPAFEYWGTPHSMEVPYRLKREKGSFEHFIYLIEISLELCTVLHTQINMNSILILVICL